jgi:hypothetical protein
MKYESICEIIYSVKYLHVTRNFYKGTEVKYLYNISLFDVCTMNHSVVEVMYLPTLSFSYL